MADKYIRLSDARKAVMSHYPQVVFALDRLPTVELNIGTCANCKSGKGPLSAGGVQDKCYCVRTGTYEKSTHYCAEWREKDV